MQMPHSHDTLPGALLQVGGRQDTPAYLLKDLQPGHEVPGPAILIDDISTVVVEPLCRASITANRDIRLDVRREEKSKKDLLTECDPIQLAIFSHRSVPVAGQACACATAGTAASKQHFRAKEMSGIQSCITASIKVSALPWQFRAAPAAS